MKVDYKDVPEPIQRYLIHSLPIDIETLEITYLPEETGNLYEIAIPLDFLFNDDFEHVNNGVVMVLGQWKTQVTDLIYTMYLICETNRIGCSVVSPNKKHAVPYLTRLEA